MYQTKQLNIKIMKSLNEIKQEVNRIEGVLSALYSEVNGAVYPETLNESIKRYEAKLQTFKWVLNN